MRFDTFVALTKICQRWPAEHGKIIQVLLGISFDKARGGFSVENLFSEGVDLEMTRGAERFVLEVKTTAGSYVTLQPKDVSGLKAKSAKDGYVPAVAALKLQYLADWVIAKAARLEPGCYTPDRLSLDSIPELESIAHVQFPKTVSELKHQVLNPPTGAPLEFLAEILMKESA